MGRENSFLQLFGTDFPFNQSITGSHSYPDFIETPGFAAFYDQKYYQ